MARTVYVASFETDKTFQVGQRVRWPQVNASRLGIDNGGDIEGIVDSLPKSKRPALRPWVWVRFPGTEQARLSGTDLRIVYTNDLEVN